MTLSCRVHALQQLISGANSIGSLTWYHTPHAASRVLNIARSRKTLIRSISERLIVITVIGRSPCHISGWHGRAVKGLPVRTIVRGRTVMRDGSLVGPPGWGKPHRCLEYAPDNSGMAVRANSDIQRAADLAGKKISVGLINSINHIHMIEWLKKAGVDAKTVQFIEIPFPQMADALLQNRLDAVWAVEPFLTIMRKSGNVRIIGYPYQDNVPNMDITAFFAKETWLKANSDVARRFRRAYLRAVTHLNEASKEERDGWVAKFTGVKPELVAEMSLPVFPTEFSMPSLRINMALGVAQRLITPFDIETMVWKP